MAKSEGIFTSFICPSPSAHGDSEGVKDFYQGYTRKINNTYVSLVHTGRGGIRGKSPSPLSPIAISLHLSFTYPSPLHRGNGGHGGHILKLSTLLKFYKELGFVIVCDIPLDALEEDDDFDEAI